MFKFYDAHTHSLGVFGGSAGVVESVYSVGFGGDIPPCGLYSVGVHPWECGFAGGGWLEQLRLAAMDSRCVAIGECGLDRLRGGDFVVQQHVFEAQCRLAVELDKAVVVHCVRALSEVQSILRRCGVRRVLYHGYKRGVSGAYVSAGSVAAIDRLCDVPLGEMLLESDQSGADIVELYGYLARQRGVGLEELKGQLEFNFKDLYYGKR